MDERDTKPVEGEQACDQLSEAEIVVARRFCEARDAGFTMIEARRFSESVEPAADIGVLRKLVKAGCPARTIARIVV